jgi:putative intracellular protease/amidase
MNSDHERLESYGSEEEDTMEDQDEDYECDDQARFADWNAMCEDCDAIVAAGDPWEDTDF